MLLIIPILLSMSSIIYELGYAYSLSILNPNTYLYYTLTIGIFIFSLGIGTYLYNFIKQYNKELLLIIIETGIVFSVPIFLLVLFKYNNLNILYIIIILVGILSGFEIPLLTDILKEKFNKILSLDYFGTLIGSLLFGFIFLPKLGIINTLLFTTLINLSIFFFFSNKIKFIAIIEILIIIFFIYNSTFENLWNNKWKNIIEKKEFCKKRKCSAKINFIKTTNYQTLVDANITYKKLKDNKNFIVNCLYIDKEVQYCSNWSDTYHMYLGKIPIKNYIRIYKKKPDVLILGGGDGLLYKKIKKYTNSIKVIDIDKQLTDIYFPKNNKDLINTDAFNYLIQNNKKYDMIFWDLPMPTNKKLLRLYSLETFELIKSSLNKNGWFVHYAPLNKKGTLFQPFLKLLKTVGFKYGYLYYSEYFSKKDKKTNKGTPFLYDEFFMISTLKKENLSFTQELQYKKMKLIKNINTIIKPNKKYILKY